MTSAERTVCVTSPHGVLHAHGDVRRPDCWPQTAPDRRRPHYSEITEQESRSDRRDRVNLEGFLLGAISREITAARSATGPHR
jgi:hypothetical protein